MKAIGLTEFGGPEVLKVVDLPEPEPGPGEVRIRVPATTLDRTPKLTGMPSISRADVAAFLLKTAVNGTYTRQTVALRTAK